jgi:tetratricopeptide (TPR) repeat protein
MSTDPETRLKERLAQGRVAFVLGAGFAMNVCSAAPSWKVLIESGIERCVQDGLRDEAWAVEQRQALTMALPFWLIAADHVREALRSGGAWRRWLEERCGRLAADRPDALEALAKLRTEHRLPVLTTNYDDLLHPGLGLGHEPVTWEDERGEFMRQVLGGEMDAVCHLHGRWNRIDSVIFGRGDYETIIRERLVQFLQQTAPTFRSLLFVGFGQGGDDPNFSRLLDWITKELQATLHQHFCLVRNGDSAIVQGIVPVPYGDDYGDLAPFLWRLAGGRQKKSESTGSATPPSGLPGKGLFVGRESERAALVDAILGTDARPIGILGPPGIGKSSLTRQALHDARVVERFGARRWFVRLDTANEERALWTSILAEIATAMPGADPAVQVLARLGDGDGLLVLDNLETPWNADEVPVEEALARLADAPGIRVVASIRGTAWPARIDWLRLPMLDALPSHEARELFLQIAGKNFAADPDLDPIVKALDGLPLAIDLLARQAQGSRTLKGLRADFEERKGRLYEIGDGKERSLRASLQLSLDSPKMTGAGKRLFTTLGRLPAGAAARDLNKLITGGHAAGRLLCQLGLAFDDGDRLRMLAPIRELAALRPMQEKALVGRYLDLARNEGTKVGRSGGAEAVARLSPEIANLEAAVDLAIKASLVPKAVAACDGLAAFIFFTGLGSTRPLLRLLDASSQLHDQSVHARGQFHLGDIALGRSQHDEARERFEAALGLYRKVGDVQGEANCIQGLGEIALDRSQHDEARERFEAALGLFRKVGDVNGEANCIWGFGEIEREHGQHAAAERHFAAALALFRQIGGRPGEAMCLLGAGQVARALGRTDAEPLLRQALSLFDEVEHLEGRGKALLELGAIEDSAEAKRAMLLDALDSHERFGNPRWIGQAHRRLARISEGEERRRHVAAAREAWTSIDRHDLVAELDSEVHPSVPVQTPS